MKQFVLALFLGVTSAHAPQSVNYFATGMNGDEDLGEDITMKGDKFHYMQTGAPTNQEALQLADPRPDAHQKKDIANKEVRPDVWYEVNKMVEPVAYRRSKEAPPTQKEEWKAAGWGNPSPKAVADKVKKSQETTEEDGKSATEAKPVKKEPEFEDDHLEPKKEEPVEDEAKVQIQRVLYDGQNHLWRF